MIESILQRIYFGIIGLGLLWFSGYQGNDAKWINTDIQVVDDGVFIESLLGDAFVNDFDEIFHSDLVITISFDIRVSRGRNTIYTRNFNRTVFYDDHTKTWVIYYDEIAELYVTDCLYDMKFNLSSIRTFLSLDSRENEIVDITLTARLPVVFLPSLQREVDLMMLWKFSAPQERYRVNLRVLR